MMKTTKTIHIAAEPEEVFRYLVDPDMTLPGVDMTMEAVHETPEGLGNVYTWTWKKRGMRFKGVTVYTEYVPNQRVRFRDFGGMESDSTWTIEPEPGGSKVTVDVDMNAGVRVPLLRRLLEPMMMRQFEKNLRTGKAEIERKASRVEVAGN